MKAYRSMSKYEYINAHVKKYLVICSVDDGDGNDASDADYGDDSNDVNADDDDDDDDDTDYIDRNEYTHIYI